MSGTRSTISWPSSCRTIRKHAVRAGVVRADVEEHVVEVLALRASCPSPRAGTASRPAWPPGPRGGMRNGPISVARAGCSLRSGWPSHHGGMRMRPRCGWPSTVMPNMSHTSRSYQLAEGQRSVIVGIDGRSAGSGDLHAHVLVPSRREQVVDDREVGRRLAGAVLPVPLVDGRQVVEHLVTAGSASDLRYRRTSFSRSRPTQNVGMPSAVACGTRAAGPKRTLKYLKDVGHCAPHNCGLRIADCGSKSRETALRRSVGCCSFRNPQSSIRNHIPSGGRSVVCRARSARFRSRWSGIVGR